MNTQRISLTHLNKVLFFVFLVSLILYLGKIFFIPVAISAFFAMLLFPVVQKLQRHGFKKPVAALISILLLLTALVVIGTVVYYQISNLERDLPELEDKIAEKANRLQWLLYETTDISEFEQEAIIAEKKPDIFKAIGKFIKNLLVSSLSLLLVIFIILTYTFFFLLYQHRIHHFFVRLHLFKTQKESKVMMARTSRIAHDYLKGTFSVISILAVVYAIGFWAIGLEHAFLFALITALLRIVPYFGSFLGIALPIGFAFLTEESLWYPLLILIFFMVTQLLEANLLTPFITGSKVKLNPLAAIMGILFGNLIWGVPGMILFVPMLGILKVIFDEVPELSPFGYILGKDEEEIAKEE